MSETTTHEPVTVVVRRRVKSGHESDFEAAMREFIRFAIAQPGNLGLHVLRPERSGGREYTVVDRFVDADARRRFKDSTEYRAWMRHLREFCDEEPYIEEMGGLAGWFTLPDMPTAKPPPRYKMAAVTLMGVYPLASVLPPLFHRHLRGWPELAVSLLTNAVMVSALTWLVMPLLTRVFAAWLFPRRD